MIKLNLQSEELLRLYEVLLRCSDSLMEDDSLVRKLRNALISAMTNEITWESNSSIVINEEKFRRWTESQDKKIEVLDQMNKGASESLECLRRNKKKKIRG